MTSICHQNPTPLARAFHKAYSRLSMITKLKYVGVKTEDLIVINIPKVKKSFLSTPRHMDRRIGQRNMWKFNGQGQLLFTTFNDSSMNTFQPSKAKNDVCK